MQIAEDLSPDEGEGSVRQATARDVMAAKAVDAAPLFYGEDQVGFAFDGSDDFTIEALYGMSPDEGLYSLNQPASMNDDGDDDGEGEESEGEGDGYYNNAGVWITR